MPVGYVLVGDTRSDIEHNDSTLAIDIIAVSQSTKLFLTCRVPYIENDISQVLPSIY